MGQNRILAVIAVGLSAQLGGCGSVAMGEEKTPDPKREPAGIEGSFEITVSDPTVTGETLRERLDLMRVGGVLRAFHQHGPAPVTHEETVTELPNELVLTYEDPKGNGDSELRIAIENGRLGAVRGTRTVDGGDYAYPLTYVGRVELDETAPSAEMVGHGHVWSGLRVSFSEPVEESTVVRSTSPDLDWAPVPLSGTPYITGYIVSAKDWLSPPSKIPGLTLIDPSGNSGGETNRWSGFARPDAPPRERFDLSDATIKTLSGAQIASPHCEAARCVRLAENESMAVLLVRGGPRIHVRYRVVVPKGAKTMAVATTTNAVRVIATSSLGTTKLSDQTVTLSESSAEGTASALIDAVLDAPPPGANGLVGVDLQGGGRCSNPGCWGADPATAEVYVTLIETSN